MNVKKTKSSKKIVLKITMSMTVESGINTFITRNGTSLCRHIPVTDVPSEKSSKWSTTFVGKEYNP